MDREQQLQQIPRIGPVIAAAIVAAEKGGGQARDARRVGPVLAARVKAFDDNRFAGMH